MRNSIRLEEEEAMTVNERLIQLMRRGAGMVAIIWLLAPAASADCAIDRNGEVYCGGGRCISTQIGTIWCSRHYEGGAKKTREGQVLCGKGQCAKDASGEIFCSSEMGGAALKDSQGHVRCFGRCEPATAEQCESTRADSSS
jgi:hypothetical protein